MDFDFLKPRERKRAAESLYNSVVSAARREVFYLEGGIRDDLDGRLELIWMFASLLLGELGARGDEGTLPSQDFVDRLFKGVDQALRDVGVGDMQIARRARKRAEDFSGRVKAYRAALAHKDHEELADALGRNLLARLVPGQGPDRDRLIKSYSEYCFRCRDALAAHALAAIRGDGIIIWPEFVAPAPNPG